MVMMMIIIIIIIIAIIIIIIIIIMMMMVTIIIMTIIDILFSLFTDPPISFKLSVYLNYFGINTAGRGKIPKDTVTLSKMNIFCCKFK